MSAPPVENFSTQYQIDSTNDVFKALKLRAQLDRKYYDAVKESVQTGGAEAIPPVTLRNQDLIEDKFARRDRALATASKIMNADTANDFVNWLEQNGDTKGYLTFSAKFADEVKDLKGVNINYLKGLWNGFKTRVEKMAEAEAILPPLGRAAYVVAPDVIKPDLTALQTAEMMLLTNMTADAKTMRIVSSYTKESLSDVQDIFRGKDRDARNELRNKVQAAIAELKVSKKPIVEPYEYHAIYGTEYKRIGEEEELKGEYKPNPIVESIEAQLERMQGYKEKIGEYGFTEEEQGAWEAMKQEERDLYMSKNDEIMKTIRNLQQNVKTSYDNLSRGKPESSNVEKQIDDGLKFFEEDLKELEEISKTRGVAGTKALKQRRETAKKVAEIIRARNNLRRMKLVKDKLDKEKADALQAHRLAIKTAAEQAAHSGRMKRLENEAAKVRAAKAQELKDLYESIHGVEEDLKEEATTTEWGGYTIEWGAPTPRRGSFALEEFEPEYGGSESGAYIFKGLESRLESRRSGERQYNVWPSFGTPRHEDVSTVALKDIAARKLGQEVAPEEEKGGIPIVSMAEEELFGQPSSPPKAPSKSPSPKSQLRIIEDASSSPVTILEAEDIRDKLTNGQDINTEDIGKLREIFSNVQTSQQMRNLINKSEIVPELIKGLNKYIDARQKSKQQKAEEEESPEEGSPEEGSEEEEEKKQETRGRKPKKQPTSPVSEELKSKYNNISDDEIFKLAKRNRDEIIKRLGEKRKFGDTRLPTLLNKKSLSEFEGYEKNPTGAFLKDMRDILARIERDDMLIGKTPPGTPAASESGSAAEGLRRANKVRGKGTCTNAARIMKGAKKAAGVKAKKGKGLAADVVNLQKKREAQAADLKARLEQTKQITAKPAVMKKEELLSAKGTRKQQKGGFLPLLLLSGLLGGE